jgi:DNA-binding XRE family transcriptional regulator
MTVFGNRLRELRESLGYGPDEFAKIIGVHRSSIYRYEGSNEAEQRDMPISVAIKISHKFNISLDWLAGTTNIKYINQAPNKLTEVYESLSDQGKTQLFDYALYLKNKEG